MRYLPGRNLGIPFSNSKKQTIKYWKWLIRNVRSDCIIILDEGAIDAISKRKSLFPAGVIKVQGDFSVGDIVKLSAINGEIKGIGVVNYNSDELNQIKGMQSNLISHRTNITPNRIMDNDLLLAGKRYERLLSN